MPIWGWADKGAKVTVSIAGQTVSEKADDQGRWKVVLAKLAAGGPHTLTVKAGEETKTLKNILVGEVWVCSGQSNMEMGVQMCKDAQKEIAAANYPKIRLFTVEKHGSQQPLDDCSASSHLGRVQPDVDYQWRRGEASPPPPTTSAASCTSSFTFRSV